MDSLQLIEEPLPSVKRVAGHNGLTDQPTRTPTDRNVSRSGPPCLGAGPAFDLLHQEVMKLTVSVVSQVPAYFKGCASRFEDRLFADLK
jgi:hypothetical protein